MIPPKRLFVHCGLILSKHSGALHLENQFTCTKLINFPNATTYCNRLKQIVDQSGNVDAPVTNYAL